MKWPASLQKRLILGALAVLLAFGLIAGYGGYRAARQEADELFDAQLAQVGQTLLTLVRAGDDDDMAEALGESGHHYQTQLVFQVWHEDRDRPPRLLLRSFQLDKTPLPASGSGFSNAPLGGETYRFYEARDPHGHFRVVVGQGMAIREELVRDIA